MLVLHHQELTLYVCFNIKVFSSIQCFEHFKTSEYYRVKFLNQFFQWRPNIRKYSIKNKKLYIRFRFKAYKPHFWDRCGVVSASCLLEIKVIFVRQKLSKNVIAANLKVVAAVVAQRHTRRQHITLYAKFKQDKARERRHVGCNTIKTLLWIRILAIMKRN